MTSKLLPPTSCSSLCSVQYTPARGERVVGVIAQTGAKQYRVDIGAHSLASLPELSFEGATKRNKPNLQVHGRHRTVGGILQ